ncbi:HNH endonuclease [Vibrio vulnificus]|uniref:HNH endonuclease n=3 Tax=Vibrio TaxID=662 RepID=UPI001167D03F|nr:HNH endonuclease [Vibrio vulnificus]EHK6028809.1 hypothetical protein [Vibrio parahaemolyticus]EJG0767718.1 hypothetical protein [Vibrio parahaemolyticus O5:K30]EIO4097462.1 hypothetical protein [Vibrio parahaemolyticus]EIY9802225.1 hypothetical protein [Vibrio parahaemolyticus]ELA9213901.1 hypothetical protein [Vibrio parahaemolyticus]
MMYLANSNMHLKNMRNYKERHLKTLLTASGGRCCFRHKDDVCNQLLTFNGEHFGEIAHIVAVSNNGPRFRPLSSNDVNSYDNLMWMCPTHHTIIDKSTNLDIFTESYLRNMKNDHENSVANSEALIEGELYDANIHDYSILKVLFEYVDINKIYDCSLDLPYKFRYNFGELNEYVNLYEEGNGKIKLRDQYLNKLFKHLLNIEKILFSRIDSLYTITPIIPQNGPCTFFSCRPKQYTVTNDWTFYWIGVYQEAAREFFRCIKDKFPQIISQELYKME